MPSCIGRWNALRPEINPIPPARLLMTAVRTASLRSLSPDAGPPVLMAKRGDRRALAQARAANYLAGDEIARFLTRVNPSHWPPRVIKQTIATIVELTLTEALARVHGDYFVDIVAYEQLHQECWRSPICSSTASLISFLRCLAQVRSPRFFRYSAWRTAVTRECAAHCAGMKAARIASPIPASTMETRSTGENTA